jgi:hypothetical protein
VLSEVCKPVLLRWRASSSPLTGVGGCRAPKGSRSGNAGVVASYLTCGARARPRGSRGIGATRAVRSRRIGAMTESECGSEAAGETHANDVDVRCVPAHSRDCGHVRSQQGARKTQNASWESRGRRVVGPQGEGGTRRCWCRIAATCAVRGGAVGDEWYVFCSSGLAYGFESSTLVHARPEWLD